MRVVEGLFSRRLSNIGVFANLNAFAELFEFNAKPSKMANRKGVFFATVYLFFNV